MRRNRIFYGWFVVGVAALAMVGTLPGRTQGLGLVTEPLLSDLHLDRLTFAHLNFWATIVGALGALGIGRLLDRFGSRVVLIVVSLALGVVVCAMSRTTTILGLAIFLTLTRALGQSALSVVSIAMVGHWFVRRIDAAMAAYSVLLSVGFMIAFPVVGDQIQRHGWRFAWMATGAAILILLPITSWLIVRRNPAAIGLTPDGSGEGATSATSVIAPSDIGDTWREAIRTGAFWAFALGAALYGLVASGIGLFNESILAERGFGPQIYYRTLVVTAMTSLAGNFLGGWLATKVPLRWLLTAALVILALGVGVLPELTSLLQVMAWAAAMGIGGGLVMVLFFSAWPRLFGRRHLGEIQGSAQALTVLASALGPVLLASCVAWTGSYAAMFRILAGAIALLAVWSVMLPTASASAVRAPLPRR